MESTVFVEYILVEKCLKVFLIDLRYFLHLGEG